MRFRETIEIQPQQVSNAGTDRTHNLLLFNNSTIPQAFEDGVFVSIILSIGVSVDTPRMLGRIIGSSFNPTKIDFSREKEIDWCESILEPAMGEQKLDAAKFKYIIHAETNNVISLKIKGLEASKINVCGRVVVSVNKGCL